MPTAAGAPPHMTDEIPTLLEVMRLLKVAERTVHMMAQKGKLPAFKVEGQWRFRQTELDGWVGAKTCRVAGQGQSR